MTEYVLGEKNIYLGRGKSTSALIMLLMEGILATNLSKLSLYRATRGNLAVRSIISKVLFQNFL